MTRLRRALAGSAAICAAACAKRATPLAKPAPPPAESATAADRLLPGELAEGSERIMGLALPRDMKIVRSFDDSAVIRGRAAADAVANYVRRRVDSASAEIGAARTVFPRAHVKGQPDNKIVRIEVVQDVDGAELWLQDLTRPEVPVGLSEAERWRKAGVVPGKPFDPNAL